MGVVTGVVADVILAVGACYLVYGVGWLVAAITDLLYRVLGWLWHRLFPPLPHPYETAFRRCPRCTRARSGAVDRDGNWTCLSCGQWLALAGA